MSENTQSKTTLVIWTIFEVIDLVEAAGAKFCGQIPAAAQKDSSDGTERTIVRDRGG